jgi:hypothetical protein
MYATAWNYCGFTLDKLGWGGEARTSFHKVLIIKPDDEVVRENWEYALRYGSLRDRDRELS